MAYIRYKPSDLDPNPEFADEVYSPPGLPENIKGRIELFKFVLFSMDVFSLGKMICLQISSYFDLFIHLMYF